MPILSAVTAILRSFPNIAVYLDKHFIEKNSFILMTPAILMSSVFCICHSALACPHEGGECGIQYFVCLWIPVTRYLPSQAQASRAQASRE
jgi:hypothetical protein